MRILYSFNKTGFEAECWTREIAKASTERYEFIPFNHEAYLNPWAYWRAQLLDNLYYERHPALLRMYAALEIRLRETNADVLLVDNFPPYHPDFLRRLPVYKVLRTSDGPIGAYDRDFAYLHAYDHVLYHSSAYSQELTMPEKLRYCGVHRYDFWPFALFEGMHDASKSEETILSAPRDIDVVFIGALHVGKMETLAKVKHALGHRIRMHGSASIKKNIYYNVKYGFPGWMRHKDPSAYAPLYQRSRIGINVHNRGKYSVGNYRLFELPGNGVMQISDGGEFLKDFFEEREEIIAYDNVDDLIEKVRYYLDHDAERRRIALNGYRRVMKDHRIAHRMYQAGQLIEKGMRQRERS